MFWSVEQTLKWDFVLTSLEVRSSPHLYFHLWLVASWCFLAKWCWKLAAIFFMVGFDANLQIAIWHRRLVLGIRRMKVSLSSTCARTSVGGQSISSYVLVLQFLSCSDVPIKDWKEYPQAYPHPYISVYARDNCSMNSCEVQLHNSVTMFRFLVTMVALKSRRN